MPSLLKKSLAFFFAAILFTLSPNTYATNDRQAPSFENWVEKLKKQALSKGISTETIDLAFLGVEQIPANANFAQKTSAQSLDQYLAFNLAAKQVSYQKQLLQRYNNVLFEIGHLFGVEPEVLIAIWTIDNLDNKNKKTFKTIDLLVSSSFKQPRDKLLHNELIHALKLIEDQQVNPTAFNSDESGLLGSIYFKPSTLRNFGIDYDADGKIDIWNNYADIFASMANYLSSIGWKSKAPWGMQVSLPEEFNPEYIDINTQRAINQWQSLGIKLSNGGNLPTNTNISSLIKPDGSSSKTYLVQDNYFTLLRWKRSHAFALAVGLMINRLNP